MLVFPFLGAAPLWIWKGGKYLQRVTVLYSQGKADRHMQLFLFVCLDVPELSLVNSRSP